MHVWQLSSVWAVDHWVEWEVSQRGLQVLLVSSFGGGGGLGVVNPYAAIWGNSAVGLMQPVDIL
jgi:hypothetical protein